MMNRPGKYIALLLLLLVRLPGQAADPVVRLEGRITDARSGEAVVGAVVGIVGSSRWAVTDRDGRYLFERLPQGEHRLQASCLGYVARTLAVDARRTAMVVDVALSENSLSIDEVVVTARKEADATGTAFVIDRNALDHTQINDVTDIVALLPGGKTTNPDLTTEKHFSLREGGSTAGNASFGTAVEVDGVRMGNNASFAAPEGAGLRSVAVENIESVEVITGVPSAEHGDLNSGLVRIRTRRGPTPWSVQLAVNPRTWLASLSKGFDLGADRGTLNISGEWSRATRKLTSPYTSYTRRGFSAVYANTFARHLRFEAGFKGNIGGMNTEDDPDAFTGEYQRVRDNLYQADTKLSWQLDRSWITDLGFEASVGLRDNRSHQHLFNSYASQQPAVHAVEEGYFLADKLPFTYFSDRIDDSKQLDCAASLRYAWSRSSGPLRSNLKAGVQWKATGNEGRGEYYTDPQLAPNGYRPRPYTDYPYMHNLALFVEEQLSLPVGKTKLTLTAGLRYERLFIRGAGYDRMQAFSPRLNARLQLSERVTLRGGWGTTEKLPSYYTLYPRQEYRDIQTFGFSYNNNESSYIYYTQPYTMLHNAALRWQRNRNAEAGIDLAFARTHVSLTGFWNRTRHPYKYSTRYTPFSYNLLTLPEGYSMPATPQIRVDRQTGTVYVRGSEQEYWTAMQATTDRTFVGSILPDNGADIDRAGVELVADFPQIEPLATRIRLDASYVYTRYNDSSLRWYYRSGWSSPASDNYSYPYVGIYADGGNSSAGVTGRRTHSLDANLTTITHIPRARLVITCRIELSLVKRSQNLSLLGGAEYAYNIDADTKEPAGGSIYEGNSATAVRPVAWVDLDGTVRPFTDAEASDPRFANLILASGNDYVFAGDGYDPYVSANLSITKEIGDHVSLSFMANNFTVSRHAVRSWATGVSAILTPDFYYGLRCRIKF